MDRIEIDAGHGLTIHFETEVSGRTLQPAEFFQVRQVHGNHIVEVSASTIAGPLIEADGMVARGAWFKSCGRGLLIKTADCLPIFYVDAKNERVVAVHAGWRGLQLGIHRLPFEGGDCDPKRTRVWVGPSLSGEDFEVGPDMWERFAEHPHFGATFAPTPRPEKKHFDAWQFLALELKGLGVEHLHNVKVNTFREPALASYRRARNCEGLQRAAGTNYSWIGYSEHR